VSPEMLETCKSKLEPVVYRRCKHIVSEQIRVMQACEALEKDDLKTFGALMHQSHESLSKDYEVSCPELDFLHSLVENNPRVYGSRMMGGGFGGCTINIVKNEAIEEIKQSVAEQYKQKFHIDMKTYITAIDSGTKLLSQG
jgi:galactokinase